MLYHIQRAVVAIREIAAGYDQHRRFRRLGDISGDPDGLRGPPAARMIRDVRVLSPLCDRAYLGRARTIVTTRLGVVSRERSVQPAPEFST